MTISPGLCSITFRSLTADEVLALAVRAGVEGIEWGADGHVPPGGGAAVEALRSRCRDAGVEVVSYGSYLGFAPRRGDETRPSMPCSTPPRRSARRWSGSGPSSA